MFADYHVHSHYSDDSDHPMDQVVADAIALGLDEICFTDHVDYGIKRDWQDPRGLETRPGYSVLMANVDYPAYAQQIAGLQSRYEGQIQLRMGLEFGMQMHTIPQYHQLFCQYPFDFIILSIHEIGDKELWTQDFQQGLSQEEYNLRYYEELLALVRSYKHYSVLGHLDLITRYDQAGPFPFEKVKPLITEILKQVIADGKGIEVNTSCHRYGLRDLTPSREILELYRQLGGTVLTLGSDSHKKEHLGAHIRETAQELKAMGFRQFCTFAQMQPIWHTL